MIETRPREKDDPVNHRDEIEYFAQRLEFVGAEAMIDHSQVALTGQAARRIAGYLQLMLKHDIPI